MNIKVQKSKVQGKVNIPGSKSDIHRLIIAASLAKGVSIIKNVTLSSDIETTINVCTNLGAIIKQKENTLIIEGIKDFTKVVSNKLECM